MVTELTVRQRLEYWATKLGIGSIWITQDYNTSYLTVLGIEYDKSNDRIIVSYMRKDTPGLISQEDVKHFLEYTASRRA